MEFDEWYDRMMDNGDSPLHYLVTQREKLRLAWNESRHISDTPILSAVPSEEVAKLYDQFDTMRGMFIDSNVGSYSFIQAMVHLGKAMKYFKEFEERRGIAG